MKKFLNNGIGEYLTRFLATLAGIFAALLNPALGLFGIALGGMGSFGKYISYVAVGAALGLVTTLVSSFSPMITGFLPGILGQIAGWLILGGVVTFLVSIIQRAFGQYGRGK